MDQAELDKLIAWAKKHKMTKAEREAQRRNFAFGNLTISNPYITKEEIDRAAEMLAKKEKR